MDSDHPSYGRQMWNYWRWKLVLLGAVCGVCFGFVLGIHKIVEARATTSQKTQHAR